MPLSKPPKHSRRRPGEPLGRVTRRWLAGVGVGVGLGMAPFAALGEPTGGTVLDGSATVTRAGKHTQIETGHRRTRMRWESFDVAADESVHAELPTASSMLVNQIDDARVTRIDGSVTSNGQLWILNPAGVYFGGSAVVEVAGLVAAAGELGDRAFADGLQHFTALRGAVRNEGVIRTAGGDVALVGRSVANQGRIVTRGGDLVLAAGDEVSIVRHDTYIQVNAPALDWTPDVENGGVLDAGGGRARLAAGDFLGLAVRNTGEIRAREIALEAGAEGIVDVAGTLDAGGLGPGGTGGRIEITGDWVHVDDARLDASGGAGGGEILVGGEAGGGGDLTPARGTFVGPNAALLADATRDGDGGEIVIWSEEVARVQGVLSAEGGSHGGDGGFIETSSRGRIEVDADISVRAARGQPGVWLLDPVNVRVVDAIDPGEEALELIEVDDALGTVSYQPAEPPPDVGGMPGASLVSADTLTTTLRRGGVVVVSTESLDVTDPGEADGDITVEAPIEIETTDPVRPNTESELVLLAAGDIRVEERIASDNDDLRLSVSLRANDNVLTGPELDFQLTRSPFPTQPEDGDRRREGDIVIDAPIETNGGFVHASGANVFVHADIDTTAPAGSDDAGGEVQLRALDVVAAGLLQGLPDDADAYGRVRFETVMGGDPDPTITTDGGNVFVGGEDATLADGTTVDAFRAGVDDDVPRGVIQVAAAGDIEMLGDAYAEVTTLAAAQEESGTLRIGDAGSGTVLGATTFQLLAGDGATPNGDVDAAVEIDPSVTFQGPDSSDPLTAPEQFVLTQDAPIRDEHAPLAAQFGSGDTAGMLQVYTTADGAPDGDFDIFFGQDLGRFDDTDLVLAAPDSVDLGGPIQPLNVALLLEGAFTVGANLAANLQPVGTGEDGFLRLQSGRSGEGDLDFEDAALLTARGIILQAGQGSLGMDDAEVDPTGALFAATDSFEIRQDADLDDANIPDASQLVNGLGPDLSYTLVAENGTLTIDTPETAEKVATTRLRLRARDGIDLSVPVTVERADVGGLAGFVVIQDLIDNLDILGTASGGDRILTLSGGTGTLSFQDMENVADEGEPPDLVDFQVEIPADRLRLVGAQIDVRSATPIFGNGDMSASPDRLVFTANGLVSDELLPTADNFVDGLGPSELFVIQTGFAPADPNLYGLSLVQDAPQSTDPDYRGWSFPVQANTRVIAMADSVSISRTDEFDLLLTGDDDVWGNRVRLLARGPAAFPVILDPVVDAEDVNSIRGLDADIDFLTPNDPDAIAMPMDEDDELIGARSLLIDQDADLAGSGFRLPTPAALGVQPEFYNLTSRFGSIAVDNALLGGTHLVLHVANEEGFVDFDESGVLVVKSLTAIQEGDFVVGSGPDGVDGARIQANFDGEAGTIYLISDLVSRETPTGTVIRPGSVSFAEGVELEADRVVLGIDDTLQNRAADLQIPTDGSGMNLLGGSTSVVDARGPASSPPTFRVAQLQIRQEDTIRNGLETSAGEDLSTVPTLAQFPDLSPATPLESLRLVSDLGDVEINDPSEVLIARSVEIFATGAGGSVILRADTGATGGNLASCVSVCGTASEDDLVLVGPLTESVLLGAEQILLEAPRGFVDAGDERARFSLFGGEPLLAIRQGDPIDDPTRLPAGSQLDGLAFTTYRLQSLGQGSDTAVLVDARQDAPEDRTWAESVEGANLALVGGLSEEDFAAAETGVRGEDPVPDPDPDVPDHVYDRLADSNGDGVVDDLDVGAVTDKNVALRDDTESFELRLRSLTIETGDDAAIELGDVRVLTESNQAYRSPIRLVGDAELTARAGVLGATDPTITPPAASIVFEEAIDAETAGLQSLTVSATDRVHFMEEIGTTTPLATLAVNLEQVVQFDEAPPTARAEFGSEAFPGVFRVVAGNVLLNPEAGADGSPFARTRIPDAATFFRRGGDLRFEVGVGGTPGSFTMGRNEKLSVDGATLEIVAIDGTVTVGDLSALDLIDVDAGAGDIHIVRRGKGPIVRANGRKSGDGGVDFVANEIRFRFDTNGNPSGTLFGNQVGGGPDARFGVADPLNAPEFMNAFSVLSLQYNLLTGPGLDFLGRDLAIDGVPDGISRVALATTYGPTPPAVPIAVPAAHRVRQLDGLDRVGIDLRRPTPAELRTAAAGPAIYQDLASLRQGGEGTVSVSEARLVSEEVELTAALYARVFGPGGERAAHVRQVLQDVVDDYKRSTGARRVVGFELRRYVYNRPSSQFDAYQELQGLDSLFRHHRRSGLTPAEYGVVQQKWLEAVRPEGFALEELSEFVHPSRYVRGSDVLDVFGD